MVKLEAEGPLTDREAALLRIQLYSGNYPNQKLAHAISRLADYDEWQIKEAVEARYKETLSTAMLNSYARKGSKAALVAAISAIAASILTIVDVVVSAAPLFSH